MKTVNVRELQKRIRECVSAAQGEHVVITRHGKPSAVLVGVEGKDWETVLLETSPSFWNLIEERRGDGTISLRDLKRRAGVGEPRPKTRGRKRTVRRRNRGAGPAADSTKSN